jgi:hypothetical protein
VPDAFESFKLLLQLAHLTRPATAGGETKTSHPETQTPKPQNPKCEPLHLKLLGVNDRDAVDSFKLAFQAKKSGAETKVGRAFNSWCVRLYSRRQELC